MVWSKLGGQRNVLSAGDFLDWQRQSKSFQQLAAWSETSFNLATAEQPEQVSGRLTTPGWFQLQGMPFAMGRDFLPEEGVPGRDHVVILTHKVWNRLGARGDIVGQTLRVNNAPYTVVGVLAAGLPDRLGPQLAAPLAFTPQQINHDYHWLVAMGRMKPGVTLEQAQADMDGVASRIAAAHPSSNRGWGATVEPFKNDFLPRDRIHNLWLLLGAVGFVLLITCVNIANLLLAKGAGRQREIAVRSSLGASRLQIFLQFLTESLVLALVGGALGVGLGAGLLRVILSLVPEGFLPSEADFRLNLPVLAVAVAATTLAGLLFGCAPAWYASQVDPAQALKTGGRSATGSGSHKLRQALIVGEFALALSLLTGAGLAIHSFWNLTQVDLGVRTGHVLTFRLNQPQGRFQTPYEMNVYHQRMMDALRSVTGVSSAAAVTGMPLRGPSDGMPFNLVGGRTYGDPSERPNTGFQSVSPDYYRTFGIDVLQGRSFTPQDTAKSVRVAMVNQEFANRYLKGMDPFRQRVSIEEIVPGQPQLGPAVAWQIVGIFHNVRYGDFRDDYPEVDVPLAQSLSPDVTIGVRTGQDPEEMTRSLAAAVHSVDAQIALAGVRTMDQVKDESLAEDKFNMRLFASFAAVALLLAAIGIYGLMAYAVSERTQEIGLRLALGAGRSGVTLLILGEASRLALAGLGIGLAGSVLVGHTMRTALYGVSSMDFSVLLGVALVLFLTALVASYLPARRAASIDPMQALRAD
jgi:putative ABC transport system permease protein